MAPEPVAQSLAALSAPLGVFAVLGNHDWWVHGRAMGAALAATGIRVLENRAVRTGPLWVAGLADLREREPSIGHTFESIPEGEPVLALSHDPDLFPFIPDRVALTLSGHTHGNQVNVPLLRNFVTPSHFGTRYGGGHVIEEGRHLFVSRGVGTSTLPRSFPRAAGDRAARAPLRLACPLLERGLRQPQHHEQRQDRERRGASRTPSARRRRSSRARPRGRLLAEREPAPAWMPACARTRRRAPPRPRAPPSAAEERRWRRGHARARRRSTLFCTATIEHLADHPEAEAEQHQPAPVAASERSPATSAASSAQRGRHQASPAIG